jgi:hypothetical protein
MTGRLLNLLTALSMVLCVAVVALWVRSYRDFGEALVLCDQNPRPDTHGRPFPVWHVYSLCSFRGRLGVERLVYGDRGFLEGGVHRRGPLLVPRYDPPPWPGGWGHSIGCSRVGRVGTIRGRRSSLYTETAPRHRRIERPGWPLPLLYTPGFIHALPMPHSQCGRSREGFRKH